MIHSTRPLTSSWTAASRRLIDQAKDGRLTFSILHKKRWNQINNVTKMHFLSSRIHVPTIEVETLHRPCIRARENSANILNIFWITGPILHHWKKWVSRSSISWLSSELVKGWRTGANWRVLWRRYDAFLHSPLWFIDSVVLVAELHSSFSSDFLNDLR